MSQHEVEVKPYGTKNEVETRVYGANTSRSNEVDYKPPYGQKNESSAVPNVSYNVTGSRADVEVKPYGTQDIPRDTGLQKPQRVTTTTTVRPIEQWRNPLMATLLGITLALTLLSLSYLPRAISGAWQWSTSWLPSWRHHDTTLQKSYDAATRDMGQNLYDKGKDLYNRGMDQASDIARNAENTGDSIYNRVKQTGENIYQQAKDTLHTGPSMTQEAKRTACMAAQKARDTACEGIDTRSWMPNTESMMRQDSAGILEQAKQKAADVLQAAKDTVTYPLNAAGENIQAARETVMQRGSDLQYHAGENIQAAKDRVSDTASQTYQAAKDSLHASENIAKTAKDTVLQAGQAAKDTVLGAGQAAANLGHAAANMASNAAHTVKETVAGGAHETTETTGTGRGPTRVKVEVQEL